MKPRSASDHFSGAAARYAAARPHYPQALFSYLGAVAHGHELAWDCGAGNGQASVGLVEHFSRVIATDASAAQIAAADPHPRIEYRITQAGSSGLPAGCADLVAVAQALHWFDLPAFYREAKRVLRPGGVLAVWTYGLLRFGDAGLDELTQHFYRDTIGPCWPPERALVDSAYGSLPFPFPELRPPPFDMTVRWTLRELLAYVRTWSAVTRFRTERGLDPVAALEVEFAACWGGAASRELSWPLTLRLGRSGSAA